MYISINKNQTSLKYTCFILHSSSLKFYFERFITNSFNLPSINNFQWKFKNKKFSKKQKVERSKETISWKLTRMTSSIWVSLRLISIHRKFNIDLNNNRRFHRTSVLVGTVHKLEIKQKTKLSKYLIIIIKSLKVFFEEIVVPTYSFAY